MKRTDEYGRAFAGSKLQMQIYVNRRPHELSLAVETAIWKEPLSNGATLWVSPLESERFVEYRDGKLLEALGLRHLRPSLAQFWPPGGPRWDALGVVPSRSDTQQKTILLVEAKSYPSEVYGSSCGAGSTSRLKIEKSLSKTKQWLNISSTTNWTGSLYQSANHLAHLYFFREIVNIEAWLINICFLNDPHSPTKIEEWKRELIPINAGLGLSCPSPYTVNVFLPAKNRRELLESQNLKSIFKTKI